MKKLLYKMKAAQALFLSAVLCCLAINARADALLAVPLYGQQMNNWCWNASCQMILDFFGTSAAQNDIAAWAVGGRDIGNNLDTDQPSKKGCKQVLKHFGNVSSDATGRLSKNQVRQEMDRSRPAILAIYWNGGGGHAVVLRGYVDIGSDMFLSIADPWPQTGRPSSNDPDTGSSALILYEAVASGPNNSADNYSANMYPTGPSGTAAVGNNWGGTLKTTKGLDIAFVIDTTGSMGDDINQVRINSVNFINSLSSTYSDLRIAVVDYKDFPMHPYGDPGDYVARTRAVFTTNATTAINAINALSVSGGNDTPESVYSALMYTLNGSAIGGWREDDDSVTKRIIILGDAPGHDPEPWPGGYSYLDVLVEALIKGIRIDAIISGSGSGDVAALASLGALASGSGGASYPAGISQIASAMSSISSNLTQEVRSPVGTNRAIRPVFAFSSLPRTLMDAPVKKSFLEVQTQRDGQWVRYKKVALTNKTYLASQPFPTNQYRWRLAYQSAPTKFQYPNGEVTKVAGGSFAEEEWTQFTRAFSAPGRPTLLTPSSFYTATNHSMKLTFTTAVNTDAYAVRVFRGFSLNPTNLLKTVTVKAPRKGTNNVLSVTVKGHKPGDSYRWQIQGLNFDRKQPDPAAWTN